MSKTSGRGIFYRTSGVIALLVGVAFFPPATTAAPLRTAEQGELAAPILTATLTPDRGDGRGHTIDVTVSNPNAEFSGINCWAYMDDTFPVAGEQNPLIVYRDGRDRVFPGQTKQASLIRVRAGERVITASCHAGEQRQNTYPEAKATPIKLIVGG
ncbi:hypothetical protein [Nocardia vulneris]|uniref:hypothetical protein n=1 Tax=Nocardia vulneris TaxID=1141657 RepID=UPI000AD6B431|nr:hypothetical protein [Nocardia vulneris]